jgi:hypothetical protein
MMEITDFVALRAALRALQREAVSDAYVADLLISRCLPPERLFRALRSYRGTEASADRVIKRIKHALSRLRRYEMAGCALNHLNQIDINQFRQAVQHVLETSNSDYLRVR